ncbi:hypothetical protein AS593_06940 [Caulobacter vibrioides]|nr:hypothetical protein AS593_06940 [Caulobacter vibrioides]
MLAPWRNAILCLVVIACGAAGRLYAVDDLVRLEGLDGVRLDPTGRWLVLETERPYNTAERFDYLGYTQFNLARPMLADLSAPGPARALLPMEPRTGYTLGPFSPDGVRVVVYRHRSGLWDMGVVTLATGDALWLDLAPDLPVTGVGVQWRSDAELLAIALPAGEQPLYLRRGRQASERLPVRWAATARGDTPSFSVVGSGRYLEDRARPALKSLVSIDARSGRMRTIASGAWQDLQVSASGRYAALLEAGAAFQPDATTPPSMWDLEGRRLNLAVVDLETGRAARPSGQRDVLWSLLSWSTKTDALLVYTRAAGETWTEGRLERIDAADARATPLASGQLAPDVDKLRYLNAPIVRAGWLGEQPAVLARPRGSIPASRPDWYAVGPAAIRNLTAGLPGDALGPACVVENDLVVTQSGAPWRITADGKTVRLSAQAALSLPRSEAGVRGEANRPAPARASDVWLLEGGQARRLEPPSAAAPPRQLPAPAAGAQRLAIAPRGVVGAALSPAGVQTIEFTPWDGAKTPLLTLNAPLAKITPPLTRPLTHDDGQGRRLTSWLSLPATHRDGEKRPLVVITYPADDQPSEPYNTRQDAKAFAQSVAVLTGQGYAVLQASYQRAETSRDPGEGFADATLNAVDAAVATGAIDEHRLALWGHSFGAYAAMMTATRTDRFKAVVAAMGTSDLASSMMTFVPHYRVSPEDGLSGPIRFGWGETGQLQLHATPWSDPQQFVRNSPVYQAGKINTPLLLVTTDTEWVPMGQSEEMFTALWRQGKDVKLVTFWGEGHLPYSPANIAAFYDQVFAFLEPLIGPGAPTPQR